MVGLAAHRDELVLSLTRAEKIMAVRGDVHVPLTTVRTVEVLDDAYAAVRGIRLPGAGIPGRMAVGTFRHEGRKIFVVVHHGRPRGIRICLEGADFDELIVECDNPAEVAAVLGSVS